MDAAIILTPYAIAYRYPGDMASLEPDRAEFDEALEAAGKFVEDVLSLLPGEVQPPAPA